MATPGALRAIRKAQAFDADASTKEREATPVTIAGVQFTRRRKDWNVNRAMRQAMREQEKAHARHIRLRSRIAELEVEQIEAASSGKDDKEAELETTIDDLVRRAEEAVESGELVTYILLALLLIPPPGGDGEPGLKGWGPDVDDGERQLAIEFLQPALDVEDAAELAREISGSSEPDPQETPSSGNGSS